MENIYIIEDSVGAEWNNDPENLIRKKNRSDSMLIQKEKAGCFIGFPIMDQPLSTTNSMGFSGHCSSETQIPSGKLT